MFDAKSILESLVNGGRAQQTPQGSGGGLGDILGQILGGAQQQSGTRNAVPDPAAPGGLGDILGQLQKHLGQGGAASGSGQGDPLGGGLGDLARNFGRQGGQSGSSVPSSGGGGLGDILGELQKHLGGAQAPNAAPNAGPNAAPGVGGQGGGLMDILGQILGQATSGVKEGAQRIDDATGVGRGMRQGVEQATGRSPDELLEQLKDLIANNKTAAGAGLGGLGAVVLGTQTGRSLAASAAKLGALVMIGGLAYKAYQNYQGGRPLITGAEPLAPAPRGSGFEPDAVTNETATLYIKAMIAAAAADGRIDNDEQQRLLGSLKQAGVDAEAEEFLANELNNPASPEQLAAYVRSGEEAVQVYTAARIAVEPDTAEEHAFLGELAQRLGMDRDLVAHIEAQARGTV